MESYKHWISEDSIIAPEGNRRLGSCEPPVSIFINWEIYNLVVCVILFKDTLFNIYCWFITIEVMAKAYLRHFLFLGNTRWHFHITRGGHFQTAKSPTKKHKNAQSTVLNRLWSGHLFTYETWNKKTECLTPAAGNLCTGWLKILLLSCTHQWARRHCKYFYWYCK